MNGVTNLRSNKKNLINHESMAGLNKKQRNGGRKIKESESRKDGDTEKLLESGPEERGDGKIERRRDNGTEKRENGET